MRNVTNNLISNVIIESSIGVKPEIGMGATLCWWTDREAATVTAIKEIGGKLYIDVQEDFAVRTDENGMSDSQSYDYRPNPEGRKWTYRWNEKKLLWEGVSFSQETKRWKKNGNPALSLGRRSKYYDYSF